MERIPRFASDFAEVVSVVYDELCVARETSDTSDMVVATKRVSSESNGLHVFIAMGNGRSIDELEKKLCE